MVSGGPCPRPAYQLRRFFGRGLQTCFGARSVSEAVADANQLEMPRVSAPLRSRLRARAQPLDGWLLFAAVGLSAIGLVMVYSTGAWVGRQTSGDWE